MKIKKLTHIKYGLICSDGLKSKKKIKMWEMGALSFYKAYGRSNGISNMVSQLLRLNI